MVGDEPPRASALKLRTMKIFPSTLQFSEELGVDSTLQRVRGPGKAESSKPATSVSHETIPACPDCQGEGCKTCMGTGLTAEDVDFAGLAREWSRVDL